MSKKAGYSLVLIFVLMGVLSVANLVQRVEAPYPIIFIRADGSIDPSTANITSLDNVTYTFTADINASIVVEKDNIVVDGTGYALQGTGSGKGIDLSGRNNVTISNINIHEFHYAIYFNSTSLSFLHGNNITNNYYGVFSLGLSNSITISKNNMSNNEYSIDLRETNYTRISGNIITNNWRGIVFYNCKNNTVSGNDIANNDNGIYLHGSSNNNTISRNNVTDSKYSGISLSGSDNNTISGNIIVNNTDGIGAVGTSFTTITGNIISENRQNGIAFDNAGYNTISLNEIKASKINGIFIEGDESANNSFYHNNIIDNTNQVEVQATPYGYPLNTWDNGFEGNYWSNYTGVDSNRDGIGDSQHTIKANNTDHYPLMGMFHGFDTPLDYDVDVISNSTIEDFEYFESNSTIIIHVSNMTGDQAFGFCRIRIPHALMNETYHVTIDGAEPYYVNYTLYDDGENRWIYFSYQHSTLEIVIVPEFPSFLLLPLFMIATLLAVTFYRRKHSM